MTNEQLVKMFMMYQESRNLSQKTIDWYHFMLRNFTDYCNENGIQVESMKTPEARQWINWLQNNEAKYKDNSINSHITAVKTMFNYFMEDEYISRNPFAKVKKIKTDKIIIPTFEPEDIKLMLNQFNKNFFADFRDSLIIRFLYDCGLRISELTFLKTSDIDTEKNLLKVFGKGHKERLVPFGRSIKREIFKYLSKREQVVPKDIDEGYFFSSRTGTALLPRNILRKIVLIGKKAGIEGKRLSPHTFRHSFAKQYLMAGGDLFSLQTIMGHVDLISTRKYISLLTEDIQKKHRQFSPLDNM